MDSHDFKIDTPSTAAIAGHPIHPMLIPFPIAFLVATLISDIVNWATDDAFWMTASLWLLIAGLATGLVAAVVGLIDFVTIDRARRLWKAWFHMGGNALVMVVAAVNLGLRLAAPGRISGFELVLSAIVTAILVVTGWLGGELAYRHGIGVNREGGPVGLAEPARATMPGSDRPPAG